MDATLDRISFGEAVTHSSQPGFAELGRPTPGADAAGIESSAAVTCRRLGLRAGFAPRLPRTPLGRMVSDETPVHRMSYVDILSARKAGPECVFGIRDDRNAVLPDKRPVSRFNPYVAAIRLRESTSMWPNHWTGHALGVEGGLTGRENDFACVDEGDAFAGGCLVGYLLRNDARVVLDMGVAVSAVAVAILGDSNWATAAGGTGRKRAKHRPIGGEECISSTGGSRYEDA